MITIHPKKFTKNTHTHGAITYPAGYMEAEIGHLGHFDCQLDNDNNAVQP